METLLNIIIIITFFYIINEIFIKEKPKKEINIKEIENKRKELILENQKTEIIENKIYDKLLKPKKIFTETETKFYNGLKNYLKEKDNILLFTKIRLADLLEINQRLPYIEKNIIFNKIKSKHIDFIITDNYGKIKVAIELDDYYHSKHTKTIENDKIKNKIFEDLSINFQRFKVSHFYNFQVLDKYI